MKITIDCDRKFLTIVPEEFELGQLFHEIHEDTNISICAEPGELVFKLLPLRKS